MGSEHRLDLRCAGRAVGRLPHAPRGIAVDGQVLCQDDPVHSLRTTASYQAVPDILRDCLWVAAAGLAVTAACGGDGDDGLAVLQLDQPVWRQLGQVAVHPAPEVPRWPASLTAAGPERGVRRAIGAVVDPHA